MTSAEPTPIPDPGLPVRAPERLPRPKADHRSTSGYLAALWIIAPLMPGLLAVTTVGWYLWLTPIPWGPASSPTDPGWAIVVGFCVTAATWFGGGYLAQALVSAPRAQPRLFADLLERSRTLRKRTDAIDPDSSEARSSIDEATTQLDYVSEELEGVGQGAALRWALASGYMSVMRSLHRAEEALIIAESTEAAVADGLHDALSLEGSSVGNRERLAGILRPAMDRLSPASSVFLVAGAAAAAKPDHPLNEAEARQALREVRFAINGYRDDRHDGLVRARNRLVWTMLAVGIATYLLLALALVAAVPVPYILAVAAYYLVGAIVGLFNRLRIEAGRTAAVEDFGLSMARLVVTPLVSGLAAVAGVYVIAVFPSLFPTGTDPAPPAPGLGDIFNLADNPLGLIYAAIFGLAPNTLTNRLAAASARLERDIQSTDAASTGASPTDDGG